MSAARQHVFLTGGSGYLGSRLIPRLLSRGHRVTALVRPHSQDKLPSGCEAVSGNALDGFLSGAYQAGDHIRATGGRLPSQPRQSGGISQNRSGSRKGGDRGGCFRRHSASCLRERRPPRFHDEGLHRSSRGMRNADPGKRPECDHSSALVRTRSRTPLALRSGPGVLVT